MALMLDLLTSSTSLLTLPLKYSMRNSISLLEKKELAKEIEDYFAGPFFVVSLLKGAFIFTAYLVRSFSIPVQVDFIWVSSYGASQESQGHVMVIKDLDRDIEGLKVLLVDDILDTGYTLEEEKTDIGWGYQIRSYVFQPYQLVKDLRTG